MTKNQVFCWDFTISKEKVDDVVDLIDVLKEHCKKWIFQEERGESGYEHYQGRVSFKEKVRKGKNLGFYEHWSPTSDENKGNDFYVTKENTRVNGPWSNLDLYIPRQVRNITLMPWQQDIVNDVDFNTRTINCIICPEGNIGKSTLCTYAGSRCLARCIPMMESYKDYMRFVMDVPVAKLYLIDMPRSLNKTNCFHFWAALESIKNGYAYDDRYNFRDKFFDCPNIWVFMNEIPDSLYLSRDRWRYWSVSNGELSLCNNIETSGSIGSNEERVG